MKSDPSLQQISEASTGFLARRWPLWLVVLLTFVLTLFAMLLAYRYYFAPSPFDPVELNALETQQLEKKLEQLDSNRFNQGLATTASPLKPRAYAEAGAERQLAFSEREINAMLAQNTNLADKLAIDFDDDLVSAQLLVPVDPGFPILGGKTVRVSAGLGLAFTNGKLTAILRGVSVMGVPIPSAWLGNLKNADLISEFGSSEGFWQSFAAGISQLNVEQGQLSVTLAE
ncbi:arginine N-succinyltransferase [Pseudomonadales bacterium]|nr:arginine N-succinyltransferase [Pseudomonadales bacterium]